MTVRLDTVFTQTAFTQIVGNLIVRNLNMISLPPGASTGISLIRLRENGEWRGNITVSNGSIRQFIPDDLATASWTLAGGSVLVTSGNIENLQVNRIGTPALPQTIQVSSTIDTLRSITSPITGTIRANRVGQIPGSNAPNLGIDGVGTFVGSMDLASVATKVSLSTVSGALGMAAGSTVKIGTLESTASITLPAGGLKGQVIINDDLTDGLWLGPASIGSTVISPASSGNAQSPFYRIPSSTLGGGAIGLAPFLLYDVDCEPQALTDPNNPPATSGVLESAFNGLSDVPVKVRFYGPIKRRTVSSWQQAIKVECRDLNSTCGWMTADMTSAFIVRGPGDSGFQFCDRTITLQRNPQLPPEARHLSRDPCWI